MKIKRNQVLHCPILISSIIVVSILLYFANQFKQILYNSSITPEVWYSEQPCVQIELFSTAFILVQPSSTILVHLLGVLTIGVGAYLLKVGRTQKIVAWWI